MDGRMVGVGVYVVVDIEAVVVMAVVVAAMVPETVGVVVLVEVVPV